MRFLILAFVALFAFTSQAQLNNWDPSWYATDSALIFHDDLDYYLNAYNKKEIKKMRKQVNIWRMNFDKMMLRTFRELREYSEGGGMEPITHDFTLPVVTQNTTYDLGAHNGRIRAFMFGSVTGPPSRIQIERWSALVQKYANEEVDLFVVYGREMHPADIGQFKKFPIPKTIEEKTQNAAIFSQLGRLPVLVDGMDDAVYNAYGRTPNGAYIVDKDGRLVFRSTWADARKVEHIVDTLLKWYKAGKPKGFVAK